MMGSGDQEVAQGDVGRGSCAADGVLLLPLLSLDVPQLQAAPLLAMSQPQETKTSA